ncbi:response regulator, partial [Nocardia sp. NPDC057455]|uniref:response regulator n=1 Tax=Nocardia sp. NPDC057455 TaxID=3346138 RepID=UPI00366EAD74
HGPAIAFRVIDTGIGITENQLETIFGAFQQADGTTSRKYGGTGLGLSISREIAYLLGGAITAESKPGKGSTFTLYLPVARPDFQETPHPEREDVQQAASHPEHTPVPATPQQHRRLLVVEERPQGLLSLVAQSAVADLADSNDPRGPVQLVTAIGVQEAAAAMATEVFHCVVLELDMPDSAALRLLETMDGDPAMSTVPVLAHNNRRLDSEQERLLQERTVRRPLELLSSLDELRERIALHVTAEAPGDVLPLVRGEETSIAAPQRPDGKLVGRTVLIVDDDARNLFALSSILELHGVIVLHAENGREGIDMLLAHSETDLVLMDVMMPEMDGYTATAKIRQMPQYRDLPIIAVTAKAMLGDREKSLASGANDYVTKPVDADALLACIHQWLGA